MSRTKSARTGPGRSEPGRVEPGRGRVDLGATITSRASLEHERGLGDRLRALVGSDAVSTTAFDRVTAAVDASHYLLTPRAVVTARTAADVAALLTAATASGDRLTFRSGGTSLSGQGVTDGILVDTRRHFRRIDVLDHGARVRVQPGATVRQVNTRLQRFSRKLGPDPASEIACTIGGVIANNSSGMACGITQNTYRTIESAIVVLPSGTVVDTADPDADAALTAAEPELVRTLLRLRERVAGDDTLAAEVRRQYSIKNTMGYGLNSFLDFDSPAQLLLHLMVGSEGTLGFVAEATFVTVPLLPSAATTLLVFDTLQAATDALPALVATNPATIELLDAASLRVVQHDPASSGVLPELDVVGHAALLVEYQAESAGELARAVGAASGPLSAVLGAEPEFTSDPVRRAALWHLRKGLYAAVAGARPSGTTALLEDISVPVEALSSTCAALQALFAEHGYDDAVIFGHAKDGNIHFLLNEDFESPANVARYRAFTEAMVDLVLAAGGSLKAEHGTGRIMAPYVERQFGPELHGVMVELKRAVDPAGILNSDAVLTTDPDHHLRHLKSTPTVEAEVDRCVECGYCEPVCPSKDLTTTPRQRIVVRRALAAAEADGDAALARELRSAERYESLDTCAVDGMCQTACPVNINTGDLVRRLRDVAAPAPQRLAWAAASHGFGVTTRLAATALTVAAAAPEPLVLAANRAARAVVGPDTVPLWSSDLPGGGRPRRAAPVQEADVVFFAACVGSMFASADDSQGAAAAFESLAAKAGLVVRRPDGIDALCCGTPWKSKGQAAGHARITHQTLDALWAASDRGALPVVCDNSSCSEGLAQALHSALAADPTRYPGLVVRDAVDFAADTLLPLLEVTATLDELALHPTCSGTRAGSNPALARLGSAVATAVTVPEGWGCCGFAGDRGMLHPELTASATAAEVTSLEEAAERVGGFDAYASCNRTCEIGMTRATGHPYRHILELLDDAAHPRTKETP